MPPLSNEFILMVDSYILYCPPVANMIKLFQHNLSWHQRIALSFDWGYTARSIYYTRKVLWDWPLGYDWQLNTFSTCCPLPFIWFNNEISMGENLLSLSKEVLLKGRLSMVDLLVLSSLDQLLFIMKILFRCFTKQATLLRRSTVPSLPPQLVFPGLPIFMSMVRTTLRMLIPGPES